ncbi:MAG: RNA methyltransferase [Flavobacteriaceae bacterium]|nr:RNA methyltransferase [Flavobacteriaceae bacterium]
MKQITSVQNQLVKDLLKLQEKAGERKKEALFMIEGIKEIQLAIKGNYQIKTWLFCPKIIPQTEVVHLFNINTEETDLIEISLEVYQKLAYRTTTEGVLAVAIPKKHTLTDLKFTTKNPLILIAEAPEKPGNIGAILRTADAANLDAVIIANPKTDLYNPNIVRSSVGGVFTNQIAVGSTTEIIQYLKEHQITIFCAALSASIPYHTANFSKSCAIVVGTEATGLSEEWLKNAHQNIIIPMNGKIDSINVSVSAAILIFEAKRQRNFK